MKADELDARARIRAHVRELIADLRNLGFDTPDMRGKSLLELGEMKERAMGKLMAAPGPT